MPEEGVDAAAGLDVLAAALLEPAPDDGFAPDFDESDAALLEEPPPASGFESLAAALDPLSLDDEAVLFAEP